jgi:MFS family permease
MGIVVVRSMTHPEPLLDLSLFRIRSFWSAAAGQVFFTTSFISIILFNTLLLQELWNWSPLAAGFGVVPGPALAAVIGGPVGSIADRVGHRNRLVFGCTVAGLSPTWLWLRVGTEPDYAADVLPALLFLGVGVSCTFAIFSSLGLREVPSARFGTASATLRTTSTLGFAVGVAVGIAVFDAALPLGPLVAFERAWAFMAVTMFVGAAFCAIACPGRMATTSSRARVGS